MPVGNLLWLPAMWGFPPWPPTTSVATAGVAFCLNQLAPGLHYSPIISKLGKVSWALTTVRSWVRSKVASSNLRMRCLGWLLGTRMLNPVHLASLRSWGPFLAPLLMQERPRSQRLVATWTLWLLTSPWLESAPCRYCGKCHGDRMAQWKSQLLGTSWRFVCLNFDSIRMCHYWKDLVCHGAVLREGMFSCVMSWLVQGTSFWILIFPNSLVIGWHKLGVGWLLLRQILTLKVLDEACMWPLKCNHLQCRTFR